MVCFEYSVISDILIHLLSDCYLGPDGCYAVGGGYTKYCQSCYVHCMSIALQGTGQQLPN